MSHLSVHQRGLRLHRFLEEKKKPPSVNNKEINYLQACISLTCVKANMKASAVKYLIDLLHPCEPNNGWRADI